MFCPAKCWWHLSGREAKDRVREIVGSCALSHERWMAGHVYCSGLRGVGCESAADPLKGCRLGNLVDMEARSRRLVEWAVIARLSLGLALAKRRTGEGGERRGGCL